ncbi:AAA family ATPase [Nocardia sp. NBC_01499]|uniref:BTAD domain-containing putative transcriptional regulator n=1 Tax=Nocardia sp. NBC_01499 TaxID=2903597 RepID=UPI00386EAE14
MRSLLALLLIDTGRTVSRERLIDGLYGTHPPGDAAHALQSQVSRLRRGLQSGLATDEFVEFGPAGYRLTVDPDAVDAHRFAQLADAGRRALHGGDPAVAAALLDEALGLWRGPALADVLHAPFAEPQAARLTEARLAAVEDRAAAALALGESHRVVIELADFVAAQPLRERARALLMRGLQAAGRQAEALEIFEHGRRLLADEFGADPTAELAEAHLAILRADSVTAPAPRRLPAQLTSFVGRDDELARLRSLLARERLVTVTGPGGTGKTRLALEAGGRARGEVCFIDLSPLADGSRLAHAFATALGVRDARPARDLTDVAARLLATLADRSLLIIADNCEHVVSDAASLIHRLLVSCPGLRVLATSREALSITGEALFPLGRLKVAGPKDGPADMLTSPAVRLFGDRAAAARPDFIVDIATVPTVQHICRSLDGLPLAIELAAARLRTLTLGQIAMRLDDRFRLLSRGDRTAAPRHRTLRAVVEWSWDLLDPDERTLASRLTVFAGGSTGHAAERVCGLPDTDELLAGLVDKSLVEAVDGRYRMLETIREFGAQRLAESGEHEWLRRTHAQHFLELAESAEPGLRRVEQLDRLVELTAESSNLQAALRWAVRADHDIALRLVAAQSWFWWLSGRRGDAAEIATELLDNLDSVAPVEDYALCVVAAARGSADLHSRLDDAAAAITRAQRPLRRPYVVFLLAMAGVTFDADRTRQHFLFEPDPWSQAFARMSEGLQLLYSGQTSGAEVEFATALASFRSIGDRWAIASALDKLSAIADWRGELDRSVALVDEAIALTAELGSVEDTADLLNRRGDALARRGGRAGPDAAADLTSARSDYERAAELSRDAGFPAMVANARRGLGDLEWLAGDPASAHAQYSAALAQCPDNSIDAHETRVRILTSIGRVALAEGDAVQSLSSLRAALRAAAQHGQLPAAAGAVDVMAAAALSAGDAEWAAELLGASVALRGTPFGDGHDVGRTAIEAARILGEHRYAAAYHRGAELTPEQALAWAGERR